MNCSSLHVAFIKVCTILFSSVRNSQIVTPQTAVLTLPHSGDTMFCHQQCCDSVNYHLQSCTESSPEKLAYSVLSTPGWALVGHVVQTLQCSNTTITVPTSLKLTFSSEHSSLVIIRWFAVDIIAELIETLFILWFDICAWVCGKWLVFDITVANAEMHHPPPFYAHIHCLVSINVQ